MKQHVDWEWPKECQEDNHGRCWWCELGRKCVDKKLDKPSKPCYYKV